MSNEPFVITATADLDMKGTSLITEVKKFEASDATVLGLDLSALSVLYSAHIGILIGGIKSAKKKNGAAVILVTNEMVYKLLMSLNLHRTSEIVRDAGQFKKSLKAKVSAASSPQPAPAAGGEADPATQDGTRPATSAAAGPAAVQSPVVPPKEKKNIGALIFGFVAVLLLIVASVAATFFAVQRQGLRSEADKQKMIITYLQTRVDSLTTRLDSLTTVVSRYQEDVSLLQELNEEPRAVTPVDSGAVK
jgi:anti-anti-sigma regulatory factor